MCRVKDRLGLTNVCYLKVTFTVPTIGIVKVQSNDWWRWVEVVVAVTVTVTKLHFVRIVGGLVTVTQNLTAGEVL